LSSPEISKTLIAQGLEPIPGTPEALGAHIRAEIEKYAGLVKHANIKLD